MSDKKVSKCIKNVIPNLKVKKSYHNDMDLFSILKILPHDVYQDADINSIAIENEQLTVKPKKRKKKFNKQILSWAFILLNIVLVIIIFNSTMEGGIRPFSELIAEAPYYRFLFLGLGIMCVVLLIEGLKFLFLIRHNTGRWRPIIALKVAVIGRYWDNITPFGSGGQPFQIYFMSKKGYSADQATGIPLAKHMFWTMAFCIIAVIVILTPTEIAEVGSVIKYLAWLGIIGNILLFSFVLLMSVNNKLGSKILNGILKFLYKIKVIKNYDKWYQKSHDTLDRYQASVKQCLKNPWQFILQVLLAGLNIILNATIAYCVYLAFNYAYIIDGSVIATEWLQIVCLSILCDAAVSLIPLPGGSGAAELSFVGLFGLLFRDDMKFWAMLFWRIFTYYGIIIIGLIFTVQDSISNNMRKKKFARLANLAMKSEVDE